MPEDRSEQKEKVNADLDSSLESVDSAETMVLEKARAIGLAEEEMHKLGIAVRECMVNAVVHGNRYNARKKVHVCVATGDDRLTVTIADEGNGFDPNQLPDPLSEENLLRHSGRGVLLMQAFVDEFEIRAVQPAGTQVKMVKYVKPD